MIKRKNNWQAWYLLSALAVAVLVVLIGSLRHPQCLENKQHYAGCVLGTFSLGIPIIIAIFVMLAFVGLLAGYLLQRKNK